MITDPLELKLIEHFCCSCAEFDMFADKLIEILECLANKDKTRNADFDGNFYIVEGALDRAGYTDHGSSCRFGWLTNDGEEFLEELKQWKKDGGEYGTD